ncbi:RNA-directed DNA polymerase from mobile element jockey [Trichonephila clavipes]|nr:RNA-directed DNA polymerase from mobile element jockey [Trichonephila clavipes]
MQGLANVEKTQAIVFRKWDVIDPQAELTRFDDNIQWVPVVRYLGLHIDSRLTYKKHIDYLSDNFWGRIALAISLIGRSSPLSLENKVILYKQILHPTITTGISVKAGSSFATPAVSSVSELHFSDDAIRRYTEAYNEKTGEKICVPLKRYRLQNFAVPTIFTDFPTYFSNSGNPTRECPEQRLQRLENEHLQRSILASIISKEELKKKKKKKNHLRRFQN